MWSKTKLIIGTLALGFLIVVPANAATVTITAPPTVNVGDTFDAQISGDFSGTGLFGGGIVLYWDSLDLELVSVTFDLPVDLLLSCPGAAACPPSIPGQTVIAWGQFSLPLILASDTPPTPMATVTFTAIGESASSPLMMMTWETFGGWFDQNFDLMPEPSFINTSVEILSATVGGTATGVFIKKVTCHNKSTNQKITIDIDGVTNSWDCEAEGLIVNAGDKIDMKVKGTAN